MGVAVDEDKAFGDGLKSGNGIFEEVFVTSFTGIIGGGNGTGVGTDGCSFDVTFWFVKVGDRKIL